MKFFKQTKETKRKISFFMALAMIISLLPVSPVAQATEDTSNVYVTIYEKSAKYVKAEVVTSGGVKATTASVIVSPLNNDVTFTAVATDDAIAGTEEFAQVKASEALTLGSISIKKGTTSTSASVVVRKATVSESNVSGVVSSTSISDGVIAEVAIAATGESIGEKAGVITGAVISINKVAKNADIEVAIVLNDGTEVTKPEPPVVKDETIEVTFTNELVNAKYTAVTSGAVEITGTAIKLNKTDIINITINPDDGYTFGGTDVPKVNNVAATKDKDSEAETYTCHVEVAKLDLGNAKVVISGTAALKNTETEAKKFAVKINSNDISPNVDLNLSSNDTAAKPVTGAAFDVTEGKTVTLEVSPKTGYVWNGENPRPSLTDTANNAAKWTEKEDKTTYEYTFTVTKASEITISGGQVLGIPEEAVDAVNKAIDAAEVVIEPGLADKTGDLELGVTIADNTKAADILANIMETMVNATTDSAVAGTIWFKDKDGKAVAKTFEEVMSAFEDKTIEMVTSVNISIDNKDYKAEVTGIENGIFGDKAEITIEDSKGVKKVVKKADIKNLVESGVALDITLKSSFVINKGEANEISTIAVEVKEVGSALEITMNIPKNIDTKGKEGNYFAIRIHGEEISLLPCTKSADGKKISFMSDKFSTYIISFLPNESGSITDPTPIPTQTSTQTPDNTKNPLGPGLGSYVPGGGGAASTSTPAPSATPDASPSASASTAPGTTSSANPADPGTGNNSNGGDNTPSVSNTPVPTKAPAGNDDDTTTGGTTTNVKVGKKVTVNSSKYKVTSVKSGSRAVQFTSGKKNAKTAVVPATVKISGKSYKVTSIANNAFKGNKKLKKVTIGANVNKIGKTAFKGCKNLKSVIIKTNKLTAKKVGANAFKGINKKATFKVPKNKVKAYKKIVKAKGAAKTVKVKK